MLQESEIGIANEGMVWERSGLVKKWEFHDWLGCGDWRELV